MDEHIDTAVLLARFKLLVRRQLAESVDLDLLTRDPAYARTRLIEIEDKADNEELLVMVLNVRDRLLPVTVAVAPVVTAPKAELLRDYKFGARAW